jgi:hypothetical protein
MRRTPTHRFAALLGALLLGACVPGRSMLLPGEAMPTKAPPHARALVLLDEAIEAHSTSRNPDPDSKPEREIIEIRKIILEFPDLYEADRARYILRKHKKKWKEPEGK